MHLRKIDIHLVLSSRSREMPTVYNGEIELGSEEIINATLTRSSIDEGLNTSDSSDRSYRGPLHEIRIKTDINQ